MVHTDNKFGISCPAADNANGHDRLNPHNTVSHCNNYNNRRENHNVPGCPGIVPKCEDRGEEAFMVVTEETSPAGRRRGVPPVAPKSHSAPSLMNYLHCEEISHNRSNGSEDYAHHHRSHRNGSPSGHHHHHSSDKPGHPLEPSLVPGYTGHMPCLQQRIGETYGQATHVLMTDGSAGAHRELPPVTRTMKKKTKETSVTASYENGGHHNSHDHHIYQVPGYTGHSPQIQYRTGETFGRATHELMYDPSVNHAEKLVLSNRTPDDYRVVTKTTTVSKTMETGTTDPISRRPVVPGYDTFVDRQHGKLGQRFAINMRQTETQKEVTEGPRKLGGRKK